MGQEIETKEGTTVQLGGGPDLADAEIRDVKAGENTEAEYTPLFSEEAVSDAELRGETDTAKDTAAAEPKVGETEQKADTGEAATADKAEPVEVQKEDAKVADPEKTETVEGNEAEDKAKAAEADAEPTAVKPPPGYVRQEALHQERRLTKSLKAENARLAAELGKATAPKVDQNEFKDFKVLTDAEYTQMAEEDPTKAQLYLYQYNRYQTHQREVREAQMLDQQSREVAQSIVAEAVQELDAVLPGLSEGRNEEAPKLIEFAKTQGVHESVIAVLTDPRTQIRTSDGRSVMLGNAAVQLVSFIKNASAMASSKPDMAKIRAEVEAELRPKLEAEIQKSVMDKIQKNPADAVRTLDQVSSSGKRKPEEQTAVVSEADWFKLKPAEQAALLGAA